MDYQSLEFVVEDLLNQDDINLPILPEIALRILEMINNPNSNLADISELIKRDQSIAAYVLKIANSPIYCLNTDIVSINQAIARLGMKLLSEITFAISLQTNIFSCKYFKNYMSELWKFSLFTAIWAKRIAFHKKFSVEAVFLGGLLHEIGKPILLNSLSKSKLTNEELKIISDINNPNSKEILEKILDKYSYKFADKVMGKWNLPILIISIACNHRDLDNCNSYLKETSIVCLADKLAKYYKDFENIKNINNKLDTISDNQIVTNNDFEYIYQLKAWENLNYYRDEIEILLDDYELVNQTLSSMMIIK